MNPAVLVSHFNPAGDAARDRNFLRLLRQLEAEGIPLFIAELIYGEDGHLLPDAENTLKIRTPRANVMGHRENLLNLLEKRVPEDFDALVWLDIGTWFQRLDWLTATAELLEHHPVAQLFTKLVRTGEKGEAIGVTRSAGAAGLDFQPGLDAPGHAWAARRSLWRDAGGLYENGIAGDGDLVMARRWLGSHVPSGSALPDRNWWAHTEKWFLKEGGTCGAVEGNLWTEWASTDTSLSAALPDFHDQSVLYRNSVTGLLEFSPHAPPGVSRSVREIFLPRNRGDAPLLPVPWMEWEEVAILERLIRPEDTILEFGGGGTTLWLAQRVREVHTVEHHQTWAAKMIEAAPKNVTIHWRRPDIPHFRYTPAEEGQFTTYLSVPGHLRMTFDCCLIDGRARIEAAIAVAPWIKPGGLLFFHDWFTRPRYTDRLHELAEFYEVSTEHCVSHTRQTLAVFRRKEI